MKISGLITLFLVIPSFLAATKEAIGQERVLFDGNTLVLASEGKITGGSLKEYIPEGEKLDSWTKLAAFRVYSNNLDPKETAMNLLQALKQQNPQAPSSMIQNPKTGEVIVDFVTWPKDDAYVEFNLFKYSKQEDSSLLSQQYALRDYRDTPAFLRNLKTLRVRLVDLMSKEGLVIKK